MMFECPHGEADLGHVGASVSAAEKADSWLYSSGRKLGDDLAANLERDGLRSLGADDGRSKAHDSNWRSDEQSALNESADEVRPMLSCEDKFTADIVFWVP